MSRKFDHGKSSYAKEHRTSSEQETRHYIADSTMQHYGAKPSNYTEFSSSNYRMGSKDTNSRDRMIDNALIGEHFMDAGHSEGYSASRLAQNGISRQQQLDALGVRFDVAKVAYEATGEHKYLMMQKDIRETANEHLDADLRQFRLSNKDKSWLNEVILNIDFKC